MRETAPEIGGFVRKWNLLLRRGDHILVKEFHTFAGQVDDRRLDEQIHVGKRFPCLQLWGLSYRSWNGDVMPCCIDALRKLKIGNLQEATIHELWNSPFIEKIRKTHMQGLYNQIPLCKDCGNWWYLGKQPK